LIGHCGVGGVTNLLHFHYQEPYKNGGTKKVATTPAAMIKAHAEEVRREALNRELDL
jgi:hypothetical protein